MLEPYRPPRLRALARRAIPHVVEGTLVPVALFYGALRLAGTGGALALALAWSYAAVLRRLLTGRRVPGLLLLGAAALTARTALAAATGSLFLYFLQPAVGNVVAAAAFLLSVPAGHPLALRLAEDFVPLPPALVSHPAARRVFLRISLLWGAVLTANAAVTVVLLLTTPIGGFLVLRTLATLALMAGGVGLSAAWFRRALVRHGLVAAPARAARPA
ncbi:MAG TPA: VC0807 family protein [Actinomycetota bacterium]|nr:VC0807 family protein [Actinomycetota bacterium]